MMERELAALERVARVLEGRGIRPVLIGGLAVFITAEPVEDDDDTLEWADPRRLARLRRATLDIDLVLPADQADAAARELSDKLGLQERGRDASIIHLRGPLQPSTSRSRRSGIGLATPTSRPCSQSCRSCRCEHRRRSPRSISPTRPRS
jgi:hypothetical protein